MLELKRVVGDTRPKERFYIIRGNKPVDITGSTVRFKMRPYGATGNLVDSECVVLDGAAGLVEFTWGSSDLAKSGTYYAELEITFPDGGIETTERFIVTVREGL